MNVLFVTENLFPDVMGGSGRVVAETGRCLALQGHTIHVVSRRVEGTQESEVRQGMTIHRYSCGSSMFSSWHQLQITLTQVATEHLPDIIVVCQPFQGLAVLLCSALAGIPVVRDFYGPWHDEYRVKLCGHNNKPPTFKVKAGMYMRKLADRHVLQHVEHTRVLSEYTADIIKEICPRHAPITIIPSGINLSHFKRGNMKDARYSLNIPSDRPVIFTVRNLTPRMGLDVLIEATAYVKEHIPDVLTIIGGDGFLRSELEQQAEMSGIKDHIQFAGRVPDELLPSYYRAADVFVLPTQALEGFGLVTIEAMACGIPVLATPRGGTLEILGLYGNTFLLEKADALTMGKRICDVLSDTDLQQEMGRQAREIVEERFNIDTCVETYGTFLKQILSQQQ